MPKDGSKVLRAQIKAGEKDMLRIVKQSKANIERKIKKAVSKKNFATASAIRSGLYKGIVSEYISLNRKLDAQVKSQGVKVAKRWHGIATDDIKDGRRLLALTDGSIEVEPLNNAVKLATFDKFSKQYLDDIVANISPSNVDTRVLLNSRLGSMAKSDVDAIRSIVTDTMREGALTGLTTPEIATIMKDKITDFNPGLTIIDKAGRKINADSYFAMLNRTVSANISREVYTTTALEAGYDLQQIDGGITDGSLQPGDPCSRWAGKIISMTGTTKGYPTYADALADGMFHPNCCVPETEVLSPDLKMASRFNYSGEMVEIKYASGNTLTVTPNHMLLTDQGFATANTLAKGDNVIRYVERQGLGTGSPDVNRKPSMIKDIFMSCRKSLGMFSVKMPMSPEDFHGDAKFGKGNIDVIFSDCLLGDDFGNQPAFEPILKDRLVFTDSDSPLFLGDGTLKKLLICAGHATNRIVSGLGVSRPPLCTSELLGEFELFDLASDVYSMGNKDSNDPVLTNLEFLRDFIVSNSAIVELDNIIGINILDYSGHVYDLQSLSTLYIANGYLSSNCVHTLSVVTPSSLPEAKVERTVTAKEGREGRKEVNEERKKEGLKPAKF